MHSFMIYFLMFIVYSFIGWIIEMFVCAYEQKKIVNRGFLIGPYCPIYGSAAIFIILFFSDYHNNPFVLFLLISFVSTVVEYLTSYFMEKVFHARWWDYSECAFNINGRVKLLNSLGFGILGLILVYIVNPFAQKLIPNLPEPFLLIMFSLLFIIFVCDLIISFNIIHKLKITSDSMKKDHTGEITEKVKEVLMGKSKSFRRLFNAFPNYKTIYRYINEKTNEQIKKIRIPKK